jgi:GAF domain-containing protein
METFTPLAYENKPEFYRQLRTELAAMFVPFWITNLSNFSAALNAHLPRLNWCGFYLLDGAELRLGPFQGLPACLNIPLDKGVCGAAARERRTQRVADVHAFPGHIACDSRSRSEIVIPLVHEGRLLGVLDVDSPEPSRFDEADQAGLEDAVQELVRATRWPARWADA